MERRNRICQFLTPLIYISGTKSTTKIEDNKLQSAETIKIRRTEKRIFEEKRELSLAVVLTFTVLMFLLTHTPRQKYTQQIGFFFKSSRVSCYFRVMTSIYEALTIKSVLECQKRKRGYLKIWYLYVLSTIQLLQVSEYNTSCANILIKFSIQQNKTSPQEPKINNSTF